MVKRLNFKVSFWVLAYFQEWSVARFRERISHWFPTMGRQWLTFFSLTWRGDCRGFPFSMPLPVMKIDKDFRSTVNWWGNETGIQCNSTCGVGISGKKLDEKKGVVDKAFRYCTMVVVINPIRSKYCMVYLYLQIYPKNQPFMYR